MGALETSLGSGSAMLGDLFRANIPSPKLTRSDSPARSFHPSHVESTSPVVRDDWNLIRQAVLGNSQAQEQLFKTHTPKLYRTVFSVLRNREDAEDVVQESWCRAYANLDSFQGRAAFSTWLTRIAINSALMLRRRKRFRVETSLNDILDNRSEPVFDRTVTEPPNPEEICADSELNALVEDKISELPPRVQAAFRLCKIEEFSITEAVKALGIRETALKSRVMRARKKIARGLRKLLSTTPRPRTIYGSRMHPRLHQKLASLRQPPRKFAHAAKP
jgi:RNA polymerase sigma-70 factor (ECF subfamily)